MCLDTSEWNVQKYSPRCIKTINSYDPTKCQLYSLQLPNSEAIIRHCRWFQVFAFKDLDPEPMYHFHKAWYTVNGYLNSSSNRHKVLLPFMPNFYMIRKTEWGENNWLCEEQVVTVRGLSVQYLQPLYVLQCPNKIFVATFLLVCSDDLKLTTA
jgi:hypothetical protein